MRWIRPYIVILLVLAVIVGFFTGIVNAEAFWVFATGLIVWWFKSRDESKRNEDK